MAWCYTSSRKKIATKVFTDSFVLTLGNKERFKQSRDVGCYPGLRPRRSQSGDRDPQLGITKAGNAYLRSLLIECAGHIFKPFVIEDRELMTGQNPPSDHAMAKRFVKAVDGAASKAPKTILDARGCPSSQESGQES